MVAFLIIIIVLTNLIFVSFIVFVPFFLLI
jgi:hypothetical protein